MTDAQSAARPAAQGETARRGGAAAAAQAVGAALARAWRGAVWYAREFSGEAAYDHYVERHAAEHPGQPPMTVREWTRAKERYDREHPNTSCCC